MFHDSYPNGYGPESKKLAVCFPQFSDPDPELLTTLPIPTVYPCSALEGSPPSDPAKLLATGERAFIFSVQKISQSKPDEIEIVVAVYRGAFNDSGHIYTLRKSSSAWEITSKWRNWVQ
jgi:hypothetical protein